MDFGSDLTVLSIEMSSDDKRDEFSKNIAFALLGVLIVSALNSAWQVTNVSKAYESGSF